MIQRYNVLNHPMARILYKVKPNDNGEWVKWDDIKHLMPFQEKLEEYLKEDINRIINGNPDAAEPVGIINGGFK